MIPREVLLNNELMAFQHFDYKRNFFIQICYPVGDDRQRDDALRRFWKEFNRHEANFKIAPEFYLTQSNE